MLFVFQVDTGRMMTFDMGLALESVETLKIHIERACKIPVEKQVLLISGGEHLNPDSSVCSYPAGTDTNPIYLLNKCIDKETVELPVSEYGNVYPAYKADFTAKVKESSDWPPSYTTVQRRTQLAQLIADNAQDQIKVCEGIVHDQHLQQQGWAAAIANLEDLQAALKHRWELYKELFYNYQTNRAQYIELVKHLKDDLQLLQKIPILDALTDTEKNVPDLDELCEEKLSESTKGQASLFDWISQTDDFMDTLYDICSKGLLHTDEAFFKALEHETEAIFVLPTREDMREIKGLSERLCGLERMMQDAKKILEEQKDLAQSFVRNQTRATQVKEASVLPDLCNTHLHQLEVLLNNHNRLRDITRRCIRARFELNRNFYFRIMWIVFVEENLSELDNKLVFHFELLINLQKQLDILEQVHTTPAVYLSTVAEVVRRRTFSQSFLLWASDIACHLLTIHNEELSRRKEFQSQFEGHFLSALFPGMDDLPPSFATQAPSLFDSSLPKLSEEDVDKLRRELPDLADNLNISSSSAAANLFMLKDAKDDLDKDGDNKAVEEKLMEVVTEAGLASTLDQNLLKAIENEPPSTAMTAHGLPLLKDLDRGCESETDTEEFEKVGQSPFDLHFDKGIPSPRPGTQDASTLTEDNLQISRSEYEKLKSLLGKLSELARQVNGHLKTELNEIKNHLLKEKVLVQESCGSLSLSINSTLSQHVTRERENIQRLTVDHELEISDFRKIAQGKNEEIKSLRDENSMLESKIGVLSGENSELKERLEEVNVESDKQVDDLKRRIDDLYVEKEKHVKEVTDRLKSEHRGELENIRARFKLMTMERSPSESSLEKIDKGEYSSITNPEALLMQMTENFNSEKEVAISDAINKENQRWQKVLEDTIREMNNTFLLQKESVMKEISEQVSKDKDKEISNLMEQIKNLNLECFKYKGTIQQLADNCEDSDSDELLKKVASLEQEKTSLENELQRLQSSNTVEMAASVAVCEGAAGMSDAATSPIKSKKRFDSSIKSNKVSIDSCKAGELVMVVWDVEFQNFRVHQDSSYLYFLNADCLETLGLNVVDGLPNKHYCVAEVVEKEYCHARKPVNRFRVPKGTKFFRVKAKPPPPAKETPVVLPPKSTLLQSHMSQSQTTSSSTATEFAEPTDGTVSLPSSPSKIEMGNWDRSVISQSPVIPEEKGEDSTVETIEDSERTDIERATELTEFYSLESHTSIDR